MLYISEIKTNIASDVLLFNMVGLFVQCAFIMGI